MKVYNFDDCLVDFTSRRSLHLLLVELTKVNMRFIFESSLEPSDILFWHLPLLVPTGTLVLVFSSSFL